MNAGAIAPLATTGGGGGGGEAQEVSLCSFSKAKATTKALFVFDPDAAVDTTCADFELLRPCTAVSAHARVGVEREPPA